MPAACCARHALGQRFTVQGAACPQGGAVALRAIGCPWQGQTTLQMQGNAAGGGTHQGKGPAVHTSLGWPIQCGGGRRGGSRGWRPLAATLPGLQPRWVAAASYCAAYLVPNSESGPHLPGSILLNRTEHIIEHAIVSNRSPSQTILLWPASRRDRGVWRHLGVGSPQPTPHTSAGAAGAVQARSCWRSRCRARLVGLTARPLALARPLPPPLPPSLPGPPPPPKKQNTHGKSFTLYSM